MAQVQRWDTIKNPSGQVVPGVTVQIDLMGLSGDVVAYSPEGYHVALHLPALTTDSNGAWSIALERTDTMAPLGLYYRATYSGQGISEKHYFVVDEIPGPVANSTVEGLGMAVQASPVRRLQVDSMFSLGGSAANPYLGAGPAAPYLNLRSSLYGAVPNSSANTLPAFNKAFTDALAAGGGRLYLPKGTYYVWPTTPPSFTDRFAWGQPWPQNYGLVLPSGNITIEGDGEGLTVVKFLLYGGLFPSTDENDAARTDYWYLVDRIYAPSGVLMHTGQALPSWVSNSDAHPQVCRGVGLAIPGGSNTVPWSNITLRGITFDGGAYYTGATNIDVNTATGDGWDGTHRGIEALGNTDQLNVEHCEFHHWRGEAWVGPSYYPNPQRQYVRKSYFHHCNGDALSSEGTTVAEDCEMAYCYTGVEDHIFGLSGSGLWVPHPPRYRRLWIHDCVGNLMALTGSPSMSEPLGPAFVENCILGPGSTQGVLLSEGANVIVRNNEFIDIAPSANQFAVYISNASWTGKLTSNVSVLNNRFVVNNSPMYGCIAAVGSDAQVTPTQGKSLEIGDNSFIVTKNAKDHGRTISVPIQLFSPISGLVMRPNWFNLDPDAGQGFPSLMPSPAVHAWQVPGEIDALGGNVVASRLQRVGPPVVTLPSGVTAGSTTHSYQVVAHNELGDAIPSPAVSITNAPATLTPAVYTTNSTGSQLTLVTPASYLTITWDGVPNAMSYSILRDGQLIASNIQGAQWYDTGVYDTGLPTAYTPATANPGGLLSGATLQAAALVSALGGNLVATQLPRANFPTVTLDAGVTPGTGSHGYQVIAHNDLGDSVPSFSTVINNAPNTLTRTNHVTLNWGATPGATSYSILRDGQLMATHVTTLYWYDTGVYGTGFPASYTAATNGPGGLVLAPRGVQTLVKAGVPADTDFLSPVDGLMAIDSTDGRVYVRYGGAWHYAALT